MITNILNQLFGAEYFYSAVVRNSNGIPIREVEGILKAKWNSLNRASKAFRQITVQVELQSGESLSIKSFNRL